MSNLEATEWEKALREFLSARGLSPRNMDLYRQAFTHRSYHNENTSRGHNERLEFLGDSVVGLVLSDLLVNTFVQEAEGVLSKMRAALVSEAGLVLRATELGLSKWILLGRGEETSGTRSNPRIISSTFEALVGAIYLDLGWTEAFRFVETIFRDHLHEQKVDGGVYGDFKSKLQEDLQRDMKRTPSYHTVGESGPEHQKVFFVEVRCGEKVLGKGQGASKKLAEQDAARDALSKLKESI